MCVQIRIKRNQLVSAALYIEERLQAFIKLKVVEYKTAALSRLVSFVIDL